MTEQINNWKQTASLYLKKRAEKEVKTEIQKVKESIIYLLLNKLTTEQSLEVFNETSLKFNQLMQERLEKISKEKSLLETFLKEI